MLHHTQTPYCAFPTNQNISLHNCNIIIKIRHPVWLSQDTLILRLHSLYVTNYCSLTQTNSLCPFLIPQCNTLLQTSHPLTSHGCPSHLLGFHYSVIGYLCVWTPTQILRLQTKPVLQGLSASLDHGHHFQLAQPPTLCQFFQPPSCVDTLLT